MGTRTCLLPGLSVGSHVQHNTMVLGKGAATAPLLLEAAPLPAPHFSSSSSPLPSSASRGAGTAPPHRSAASSTVGATPLCPHQTAHRSTCLHARPQHSRLLPELTAMAARHPDSGVTGTLWHQPWAASPQGHTGTSLRDPVCPSPMLGQAHGDFTDCRSDSQHNPPAPSVVCPCLGKEQQATGRFSPNSSKIQTRLLSVGPPGWSWPRLALGRHPAPLQQHTRIQRRHLDFI